MKFAVTILKEQFENFNLVRRLSLYELKSKNKSNLLGMLWEIINPLIQILVYWFVFGSIMQRADIQMSNQSIPYIAWLIVGYVLWIFFFQSTIQGSNSIYTRLGMLSKMKFPMSAIPSLVIISQLYVHIAMLLLATVILQFMGIFINIYYLQLIYFCFATICLLFGLALITSTLSTIVRDVHMFLNAALRMFLYISPVLWPISHFIDYADWLVIIIKMNPLYYLIEGYRAAFFGTGWYFIENWEYTLYFWIIVIVIFIFGAMLHTKFRRHFIDFL